MTSQDDQTIPNGCHSCAIYVPPLCKRGTLLQKIQVLSPWIFLRLAQIFSVAKPLPKSVYEYEIT